MSLKEREQLLGMLKNADFEIYPEKSISNKLQEIKDLPTICVTSSPSKTPESTIDIASKLRKQGNKVIPHLAARQIRDKRHLIKLCEELTNGQITDIFVVGGDSLEPIGEFSSTIQLLEALEESKIRFGSIGVAGYPEPHNLIPELELKKALYQKQDFSKRTGIPFYIVTQMCFDEKSIASWCFLTRSEDIYLPIYIGVPAPMDLVRLTSFATKCGLHNAKRFLEKKSYVDYEPTKLLVSLIKQKADVQGIRFFTFNNVLETKNYIGSFF